MVVPIALDDAARAAIDAAQASESGNLLIAPRLEDRYPSYGVIAKILQVGRIAGGGTAAVVRGERRAHIGAGASGPGAALWVEVTEVPDVEPTDEVKALAAEYKKLLLAMLQRREAWQIVDYVNSLTDPSALADTSGYASYLTDVEKRQLLETADVAERLRVLIDWTSSHLAEVEVNEKIADDVREGMEKTQKEFLLRQQLAAIRKELGEGEPDGSDDYRARVEAADLPEKVREAAHARGRQAGTRQRPEPGKRLDPHVAGHRARPALERPDRGLHGPDCRPRGAGRRPPRAGGRQGPHHRVPGGAQARRAQRGLQVVGGRGSGAVMALVGPPGVGKTSLGECVARATGPQVRAHRRWAACVTRPRSADTGAPTSARCPAGSSARIRDAGTMNPVMLLDEVDKVGAD